MEENVAETDLRAKLSELAHDGPTLGFTPASVLAAGRRKRRRRTLTACGTSVAVVAAVTALSAALPASPWAPGANAARSTQIRGNSTITVRPPAAHKVRPPHPVQSLRKVVVAPVAPGHRPACAPATDAQWSAHLAFTAKLRALLPAINGTMSAKGSRTDVVCPQGNWLRASWAVTGGNSVGTISGGVGRPAGQYRLWLAHSPCATPAAPATSCTMTLHGNVLVRVLHRLPGTQPGAGESITVTATWPDDTSVEMSSAASQGGSVGGLTKTLPTVPMTEQQLVAVTLNAALRS